MYGVREADGISRSNKKEFTKVDKAIQSSIGELERLRDRALTELGEDESGIFQTHLMLLEDPQFTSKIRTRIASQLIDAEQAVKTEITDLERKLQGIRSDYLRERSQDVRDVGRRLQKNLADPINLRASRLETIPPESVIVARKFLPSDTIALDRTNCVAVISEEGGISSHAAILAASLGIPMIAGISETSRKIRTGDRLLVDGQQGVVTISPTRSKSNSFRKDRVDYDDVSKAAVGDECLRCCTADGVDIQLLGNLQIMLPMVLVLDDLQHAKEIIHRLADHDGIPEIPPIGVMIETPAAVFEIEKIVNEADFISIGTNDLTQFILAADRGALGMADYYSTFHPAVLRAISSTIEVANEYGRRISVCGEIAGDPLVACLLIGFGLRNLSMGPIRTARVRRKIRQVDSKELVEMARKTLGAHNVDAVTAIIDQLDR